MLTIPTHNQSTGSPLTLHSCVISLLYSYWLGLHQTIQPKLLATKELIKLNKAPELTKDGRLISSNPYNRENSQSNITNGAC